jgi:membrane protein required for beta-lactamase induction
VILTVLGCVVYVQAVQSLWHGLVALGFLIVMVVGQRGGGRRRRSRRLR